MIYIRAMKATRADKALVAVFIIMTALSFNVRSFFSAPGSDALVYVDSALKYKIDMGVDKEYQVPVQNGVVIISVSGGRLYVRSAPCPRRICMMSSPVFKEGDTLVCVPNKMLIRVDGEEASGLDTLTK